MRGREFKDALYAQFAQVGAAFASPKRIEIIDLLAQGERGLARTALLEAEHIQQDKSFSQQGRKEIKYGTRALLTSGRSLEDL